MDKLLLFLFFCDHVYTKRRFLICVYFEVKLFLQKQPPRGVLKKRCSENAQQIYRRTPIPKCDFNKNAKQIY